MGIFIVPIPVACFSDRLLGLGYRPQGRRNGSPHSGTRSPKDGPGPKYNINIYLAGNPRIFPETGHRNQERRNQYECRKLRLSPRSTGLRRIAEGRRPKYNPGGRTYRRRPNYHGENCGAALLLILQEGPPAPETGHELPPNRDPVTRRLGQRSRFSQNRPRQAPGGPK